MLIFHHNFISPKEKQEHKSTDLSWRLYCVPHKTKQSNRDGLQREGQNVKPSTTPTTGDVNFASFTEFYCWSSARRGWQLCNTQQRKDYKAKGYLAHWKEKLTRVQRALHKLKYKKASTRAEEEDRWRETGRLLIHSHAQISGTITCTQLKTTEGLGSGCESTAGAALSHSDAGVKLQRALREHVPSALCSTGMEGCKYTYRYDAVPVAMSFREESSCGFLTETELC